jgi:hypothetical protein
MRPSGYKPPRNAGETAARCFELLNDGRNVSEIVIELRETPEAIQILREAWLDCGGSQLVITPVAKVKLEELVGKFTDIVDLIDAVRRLASTKSR